MIICENERIERKVFLVLEFGSELKSRMRCFGMLWIKLFANICAANDEVRSRLPRLVIFFVRGVYGRFHPLPGGAMFKRQSLRESGAIIFLAPMDRGCTGL